MSHSQVILWLNEDQLKRWSADSNLLGMNLFEYVRHATDAYYNFCHQHDIPSAPLIVLEEKFDEVQKQLD